MIPVSKVACALLLATSLAAPAFAAPGDAGSGPTTGVTTTNDAGSGPTKGAAGVNNTVGPPDAANAQQGADAAQGANPGPMHVAQKMRADLTKAGFTDIHIMPSSFLVGAKGLLGKSRDDGHQSGFDHRDHRGGVRDQRRQRLDEAGRRLSAGKPRRSEDVALRPAAGGSFPPALPSRSPRQGATGPRAFGRILPEFPWALVMTHDA